MWVKPNYSGTLEDLSQEVQLAIAKFEQDLIEGTILPVDDQDKTTWL